MKKRFFEKKAQAFLIGAVLLIGILVGLVTVSNYAETSGFSTLESKGEKIDIESEKVMDYALINKKPSEKLNSTAIKNFTLETTKSLGPKTKIYFIENSSYSGNSGPIDCYNWNTSKNPAKKEYCQTYIKNQKIISTIERSNQTFPKTQGKHFYFVMIKESQGERHIYKNTK
ncbi:MAG: hypothetical protein ABEI74_04000 [Candidatus Pacearchaeota archaeon]